MNRTLPSRQRGVVLLISLIVLVAMTLAGVSLMRSVDTTVVIAGNFAFKQSAIQAADRGLQEGVAYLENNNTGATLYTSNAAAGYFSSQPVPDPSWFDETNWAQSFAVNGGVPDAAGNVVRYQIHRMCTVAGASWNQPGNECGKFATSATQQTSKSTTGLPIQGPPKLYYRVTARVDGPRNTVSVVQTTVLLNIGS